jgi:uncharacterized protein (DUF1800 family)
MARPTQAVEHLLRRAGFGVTPAEAERFSRYTYPMAVAALTEYDPEESDDVDSKIESDPSRYVRVTVRGQFSPNQVINDARQRWLFRMVHSTAPLQERMALIWHHHFATAYTKIQGVVGATDATRMMAAKPSEDPGRARGQIELFRQYALGNFRELLVEVAKDPAMLVWLDGDQNFKEKPQENFGRELMELFTFGVEHYVESDVYAAARVFTGWNRARLGVNGTASAYYAFNYNAARHDTNAKDFTFPIYPNGSKRIEARSATTGMQDGLDLINALAIHPETAKRLARRLWTWFVSEVDQPDEDFVRNISDVYLKNDTNMKPVVRAVLFSPQFLASDRPYQRYSWPVEFVVRTMKEVGYVGFSVDSAMTPLINMGQQLFEPPDVNGWEVGPGWFSTGGMLARMNFAAALATNQRVALRDKARVARTTPEDLLSFVLESLSMPEPTGDTRNALLDYVRAGGTWTGSDTQLLNKTGGLVHLLTGSGSYQLV